MLPLQIPGILFAGRMLLSKYNPAAASDKRNFRVKQYPKPQKMVLKPSTLVNQLQTMFKGLTTSLSKITNKTTREDYNAIVKSFIPGGAKLLTPQYPSNSRTIQFADLDGDSQDEMIASYKIDQEIRTILLKKQNDRWNKIGEISNSGYDTIHYRNLTDIAGIGRNQLLVGLSSTGKRSTLYGYSLESGSFQQMFAQNYHKLDVAKSQANRSVPSKTQLALWNEKEGEGYDVELLHWNRSQLEPVENTSTYYFRNVAPYYVKRIKQMPYNASHWYNLSDALVKAEAKKDALMAIEVGMALDKDSKFKDKFQELKDQVMEK